MTGFVRASELYDVEAGEAVPFDWAKMQPVTQSQTEIERAVSALSLSRNSVASSPASRRPA